MLLALANFFADVTVYTPTLKKSVQKYFIGWLMQMVCARSIPFFYKNRRCVEGQMQIYLLSSITHTHKWQSIRYSKCINTMHNQRLMHILVIINHTHTHTHRWQFIRYSKCINTLHYQKLMHILYSAKQFSKKKSGT